VRAIESPILGRAGFASWYTLTNTSICLCPIFFPIYRQAMGWEVNAMTKVTHRKIVTLDKSDK